MTNPQSARIRELNDLLRSTWLTGKVYLTSGIRNLPLPLQSHIAQQVQTFRDFRPSNDPHGEHDFGAFTIEGCKVFWKIDYYSRDANGELDFEAGHSADPSDPAKTVRVLTIMLAEEY